MANHPLTVYLRGHYAGGHTAIRRLREQAASDPTSDQGTFLGALATEIDADLSTLQDVMARLGVRASPLRNAARRPRRCLVVGSCEPKDLATPRLS